jgi:hypothetical protein
MSLKKQQMGGKRKQTRRRYDFGQTRQKAGKHKKWRTAMRLIFTENGYLNLAFLKLAKPKPNGRLELIGHDDQVLDADCPRHILNTVTETVRPAGDWEVLNLQPEDDGPTTWYARPVLAWGVTLNGQIVPISSSDMDDVDTCYGRPQAIRKIGDPKVYCGGAEYPDADAWFADALRREPKLVAG